MSTMTTGDIAKALWPGLNAVWGADAREHPTEYTDLYEVVPSDMNYEEDLLVPGFGLAPMKPEGSAILYQSTAQGLVSRYTHVAYGSGFIVTREAIDDNKYEKKALRGTKWLARSFRQTKENVAANVYNRAHNSSYLGADGVVLCSTAHPTKAGSQVNRLTTAADLSEASLEDMIVLAMNMTDDAGLKSAVMPRSLIIPTAEVFNAERILKSIGQNDTANNAINAVRSRGSIPEGSKVNHYLTDTDSVFLRTDAEEGMKLFERVKAEFGQDNDFDTSNLKYKGYERYSAGWTNFRGVISNGGGA